MSRMTKGEEPEVFNRVLVLRTDRGLSRQELADAIGVHYQTIGYVERGEYKPSLVLALQLAAFFRLPVEEIFALQPMSPLSERIVSEKPVNAVAKRETAR